MAPPQQAFEFEQAVRAPGFASTRRLLTRIAAHFHILLRQVRAFAAHFDLRPDKCTISRQNFHLGSSH
jgi:hypothetical protein